MIFESEFRIDFIDQFDNALDLVWDLFRCHINMCIILVEAAYTHQTVQLTGFFVSVNQTDLTHADRKITIRMRLHFINQHAARAVHRFDRKVFVIDHGRVHVFTVVIPVTGSLPKLTVQHDRGRNFYVAVTGMDMTPVIQKEILQDHALWQEERESRTFFHQSEDPELFSEFPVITFLCFLDPVQFFFQRFFIREGCAVNTSQHFILFIATPVCAGNGCQLEGFDRACICHMRPCTKFQIFSLLVERKNLVFRKIIDQFNFVIFPFFRHDLERLFPIHGEVRQLQVFFDDLFHFCFDLGQICVCEIKIKFKVIIKTIFDCRTDGTFRSRIQSLHGLCHDMGCRMPEGFTADFILK